MPQFGKLESAINDSIDLARQVQGLVDAIFGYAEAKPEKELDPTASGGPVEYLDQRADLLFREVNNARKQLARVEQYFLGQDHPVSEGPVEG